MKLLLDENLPKRLKNDLSDHEIFTVREKEWNGLRNGELLKRMIDDGFHALLTFDKNLEHQQNFRLYPVSVLVLTAESNQYENLRPLVSQIQKALVDPKIGVTNISGRQA